MKIWLNDAISDSGDLVLGQDNWPDGFGVFETIKTWFENHAFFSTVFSTNFQNFII
jgi:hypothetical protein